jgi:hypothetical protein
VEHITCLEHPPPARALADVEAMRITKAIIEP